MCNDRSLYIAIDHYHCISLTDHCRSGFSMCSILVQCGLAMFDPVRVASCASTIARSSWSSCSASSSRTRVSNSSTRASRNKLATSWHQLWHNLRSHLTSIHLNNSCQIMSNHVKPRSIGPSCLSTLLQCKTQYLLWKRSLTCATSLLLEAHNV